MLSTEASTSSMSWEDTSTTPGSSFASAGDQNAISAKNPIYRLPNDMSLWEAVCDPTDEQLRLSCLERETRREQRAITDGLTGACWTYEQLRQSTLRCAQFIANGLGPIVDKRILVLMPSGPEALIVFLSVLRAGGIVVMCNAGYTPQEMLHNVLTASPHAVISDRNEVLQTAKACLSEMPESDFLKIDVHSCTSDRREKLPEIRARHGFDTALIVFSSGTSGLQKAVELTHEGLIALYPLQISASFYNFAKQDTAFLAMPMYHIGGLCSFLLTALKGDHGVLMPPRRPINFQEWVDAIIKYRCSKLQGTPGVLRGLLKSGLARTLGDADCLSSVSVGAGTLSPWLKLAAQEALRCSVLPNYGLSEVGGALTRASASLPTTPGSVGRLSGEVRIRIVDANGDDCEQGELLIKSPTLMKGYYNNAKATMEAIDEHGWFHTGDLARFCSKTEELFIIDRVKELIKYKGWSIAPAELEAVLESHSLVVEAAVVGVQAGEGIGEMPKAFVVLRNGLALSTDICEELHEMVRIRCLDYKWLRGGIVQIQAIPKNASNKVLRRVLRTMT